MAAGQGRINETTNSKEPGVLSMHEFHMFILIRLGIHEWKRGWRRSLNIPGASESVKWGLSTQAYCKRSFSGRTSIVSNRRRRIRPATRSDSSILTRSKCSGWCKRKYGSCKHRRLIFRFLSKGTNSPRSLGQCCFKISICWRIRIAIVTFWAAY